MDFNGCYESKLTATDTNIGNTSSSIGNTRPHIGNKRSHIGDIRPHIGNIRPHFANTRLHIEHTRPPTSETYALTSETYALASAAYAFTSCLRLDFHGFLGFHAIHEWPWDHAFPCIQWITMYSMGFLRFSWLRMICFPCSMVAMGQQLTAIYIIFNVFVA